MGCKDIGVIKFKFVAKTQLLFRKENLCAPPPYRGGEYLLGILGLGEPSRVGGILALVVPVIGGPLGLTFSGLRRCVPGVSIPTSILRGCVIGVLSPASSSLRGCALGDSTPVPSLRGWGKGLLGPESRCTFLALAGLAMSERRLRLVRMDSCFANFLLVFPVPVSWAPSSEVSEPLLSSPGVFRGSRSRSPDIDPIDPTPDSWLLREKINYKQMNYY